MVVVAAVCLPAERIHVTSWFNVRRKRCCFFFFLNIITLHIIIAFRYYRDEFGVVEEYELIGFFTDYLQAEQQTKNISVRMPHMRSNVYITQLLGRAHFETQVIETQDFL
jgi:hypothetical protein